MLARDNMPLLPEFDGDDCAIVGPRLRLATIEEAAGLAGRLEDLFAEADRDAGGQELGELLAWLAPADLVGELV
jgi:hypothetical protein